MKIIIKKQRGFIAGFLIVAIFFILVITLLFLYGNNKCNSTVYYSIGSVDSRFKISQSEIIKTAQDAAGRWNIQSGKNLLRYEENSKLKIDLIYDYRQAEYDKVTSLSQNLDNNKSSVDSSNKKFDALYKQFQNDLDLYNSKVDYWNGKGGAPNNIYQELQTEKALLDKRHNDLVKMSDGLNIKIDQYNSSLSDLQKEVDSRQNTIITQGLYKPAENKIDVFTFGNIEELQLVLMHELGHSLGLDHDSQNKSIMYYLLGDQNLKDPTLSAEDKSILGERCDINKPNFYLNLFNFHLGSTS
jgi:hypothetical protein